jgi:hypothetical protein
MEKDTTRDTPATGLRKNYAQPVLIEYGSIAKLTQGTGSVGNDGGPGMMNPCL